MEEAIKKIIEMLEKGKITAEDAERLIKAVKEAEKKEREYRFFDFGWIPEMVKDAIHSAFIFKKGGFEEVIREIPLKEIIKVTSYNGDIKIKTQKRDNIKIEAEGANFKEEENEIIVNSYGDIEIFTPEENNLIIIYNYSGEVELEGNFKKLKINTYSGDISIDGEFDEMDLDTYNGDCKVETKRKPIMINFYTYSGKIELPEGFKKEGNFYIYGEGEYKRIDVRNYSGDFELKFKEE